MRHSFMTDSIEKSGVLFRRRMSTLAFLMTMVCLWPALRAQSSADNPPPAAKSLRPLHRSGQVTPNPAPGPAAPAPVQAVVPAPAAPKWPVNETATQPSIQWDSKGLEIEATNSSLRQILNDVSMRTGAKVEGLGSDERVFGVYGPGQARDVLSQLLHGSSYNVLMIGDQGEGTPREIVLSARTAGAGTASRPDGAAPSQGSQDDDAEPEPEEPQQPMNRMPMNQPGAPRTPQQMLQELQQRQQQMQENQQPH